jgi:hypothetical protein
MISHAVGPVDADAVMFSDPFDDRADDAVGRDVLRELGPQLLPHGDACPAGLEADDALSPCSYSGFCRILPNLNFASRFVDKVDGDPLSESPRQNCSSTQLSGGVLGYSVGPTVLV